MQVNLDQLIATGVEKPARYTGGEWNSIVKENADTRMALCFPDVYEIGMSHLGSRILYEVINDIEGVAAERVFAPWIDLEAKMRETNTPLFSLETKRELKDFDILGFSILYEMCYTNILTMLEISGIPFRSSERTDDMPLIICGGPSACNPEPIADFMDAVCIGEGEEMMVDVVEAYRASKAAGETKKELLLRLQGIEGVYIPSFYDASYDENGKFIALTKKEEQAKDKVTRRVVMDMENARYLEKPIVPYLNIVHDRVAAELFRGCTRGCRFCQAGYIYRPVREKTKETVLKQAMNLIGETGYDEVSLFSLSSSDYSDIHDLIDVLMSEAKEKRVSVSLPSLRVDRFIKEDLNRMQEVRKAGLTFAPEAGSQRLRDVINKGVTEEDLMRVMKEAFEAGWTGVKLYFMIGLPTETDEDVLGIVDLAKKVSNVFYSIPKEQRGKGFRLTVSASSFVPKPFTPFQWAPQDTKDEIKRKQRMLKDAMKGVRGAQFKYHAPDVSVLEAVFSRGDRRLSHVIEGAYKRGARFDSWDECFRLSAWEEAFEEVGLTQEFYANRERDLNEALPYDHIDMIVEKAYFMQEWEKAVKEETTADCRDGCNMCFGECNEVYC